MKISDLIEKLDLKLITRPDYTDKEVTGCYVCDLLSRVMSMAKQGDVWITVQTNLNIVAIASLTEAACIIVPEDIEVDYDTVLKANSKDVTILGSALDGYNLCVRLGALL
jgi:hypothetical protein